MMLVALLTSFGAFSCQKVPTVTVLDNSRFGSVARCWLFKGKRQIFERRVFFAKVLYDLHCKGKWVRELGW